jgi:hypothetical protein
MLCTMQYKFHCALTFACPRMGKTIQLLGLPDVGEDRLDGSEPSTIDSSTLWRVNGLLHHFSGLQRAGLIRLKDRHLAHRGLLWFA